MNYSVWLKQNWLSVLAVLLSSINLILVVLILVCVSSQRVMFAETYWNSKATAERTRQALPTAADTILDEAIRNAKQKQAL